MNVKTILLVGLIGVAILTLSFIALLLTQKTNNRPLGFSPSPTPVSAPQNQFPPPNTTIPTSSKTGSTPIATLIGQLAKTTIKQTTDAQVTASFIVQKKTTNPDGSIKYDIKGATSIEPDTIVTENGVVIFERRSLSTAEITNGPRLSDVKSSLGNPEKTIAGNVFHGFPVNSYLYPTQGVVVLGNSGTDEIYEIQHFVPMGIEQYLSLYGTYVKGLTDAGE